MACWLKTSLASSVSALALALVTAAGVQDAGAQDIRAQDIDAQDIGSEDVTELYVITVTGERVERSVYETPSSVSVTTGEEIGDNPSLREVDDLYSAIPNITATGAATVPAIRGVDTTGPLLGSNGFIGGTRPRATTTIDGRPISNFEYVAGATSIYDVDRVEVFLGPQTTSQGVNSIAGATYIVTADPTFTPEFKAQAEAGNYMSRRVSGAASGPIVDGELAGRLSVDYQQRESFVDLVPLDDKNEKQFEHLTLRGKLLWEPSALPGLSSKLTISRSLDQSPQGEYVREPIEHHQAGFASSSVFRTNILTAGHDVSYVFGDGFTLSNRFIYTDLDTDRFQQFDFGRATIDTREIFEELTLKWSGLDGRLTGVVGGSAFLTNADEFIDFTFIGGGYGVFDDKRESLGLFTEATYALTDRLDVTAGLRYQRDSQDRQGALGAVPLDIDETYDAVLPKFAIGYDVSDTLRVGAIVSKGFNPGGASILFGTATVDEFDEETLWNYEVFARSSLFDDRLQLNANAFLADYQDYQRDRLVVPTVGLPFTEITNYDDVRNYGLELSFVARPTDALKLSGGLGLLKTEFVDDAESDPATEGKELARAPNVTASLGVDYEISDGLALGSRLRYSSSYYSDNDNLELHKIDPYVVVDFNARYQIENVELYGYLNNAFDEAFFLTSISTAPGNRVGEIQTPREFGAGLRVKY